MSSQELELPTLPEPSFSWEVPPLDKLAYFYGQVLTPQQLQRAQKSVHERAKLHNRCLHGWGVVCGLEVKPSPPPSPDCPPGHEQLAEEPSEPQGTEPGASENPRTPNEEHHHAPARLWLTPGMALDSLGHELIVREPISVDVFRAMSREDQREIPHEKPVTLYVSLRYHAFGIEPSRPQLPESCGMPPDPAYTFFREGVCVEVSLCPPAQDERCETCCTPAPAEKVLLARIDGFIRGRPIRAEQIHNEVRRPLSLRVPTVITGVSWHHGASYRAEDVDTLLWSRGVQVRFSRPIHAETLRPGTFDVILIELGKGRSGTVRMLKGEFLRTQMTMVQELTYRLTDNERVDPGDRILFVLRTDFLLDACCAPVDGSHVGGRVPAFRLEGYPAPAITPPVVACRRPPRRFGSWTSGDGAGGGTFESWIFVVDERDRNAQKKEEA